MPTTDLMDYIKVTETHVRVTLTQAIVDAPWAQISQLGDQVIQVSQGRRQPSCLVDLTQLNFMGSSMVALIVRIWKEIKSKEGKLVVVTANDVVRETINLAGLDKIWEIRPTVEAAYRALKLPGVNAETGELTVSKGGVSWNERFAWIAIVLTLIAILAISVYVMDRTH